MLKFIRSLTILLILSVASAEASTVKTLSDFVDSKCSKGCVDTLKLRNGVLKASKEYNLSPNLILSIISVESGFIRKATNGRNIGLMQVNLRFHKPKFKGQPYTSPKTNISVGSNILKNCLNKHKNRLNKSLECYNGHGDPKYVFKVKETLKIVKRLHLKFK